MEGIYSSNNSYIVLDIVSSSDKKDSSGQVIGKILTFNLKLSPLTTK